MGVREPERDAAAAFAPLPVLRYVAGNETARALAFGMIFGKPRQLDPKLALEETLALRAGRSFRPIGKEAKHYRYAGESETTGALTAET